MKNIVLLITVCFLFACDSENAPDCFQVAGEKVQIEYTVSNFNKIRMENNVSLLIRQGDSQEVIIETGENLVSDITVSVEDGILVLRDNNECNYVRDFGLTRAIVTTPDITEIRNGSSYNVVGEGVLNFPNLSLISNTTGGFDDIRKSGDFTMTISCENLNVASNGFSGFYIDGTAKDAVIALEDEVTRFEGQNLIIDNLRIFHRSANKMIVNPQLSIEGRIVGPGDVISLNRPEIVDVEELFTGRLIFQ